MNKYYEVALFLSLVLGGPYLAHYIGDWAMRRAHRRKEKDNG